MKKIFPYLILLGVLIIIASLIRTKKSTSEKTYSEKITLKRSDRNPYGAFVAFNSLSHYFPQASVVVENDDPLYWDSLSHTGNNQLLMIISHNFFANESELEDLIEFVKNGNYVFLSTVQMSATSHEYFGLKPSSSYGLEDLLDTLEVYLATGIFPPPVKYRYPGKKGDTYIYKYDTLISEVLGTAYDFEPNLIKLQAGKGFMFIHTAPLTFSNYFLLHKNNYRYYHNIMSMFPSNISMVAWDNYFINKRWQPYENKKRPGFLSGLMKEESLRTAFWLAVAFLFLYVIMEMRRKQKMIPVIKKPVNDSLDFVKTIGRLYYDKRDHLNLARKMGAYFLEHVRSNFKMATSSLDAEFARSLHSKTGYPLEEINSIISFIQFIQDVPAISDSQLSEFYKRLEDFYHKT